MILISDSVAALDAADASFPVIGYDNIVSPTTVTTTTENSSFPASNLGNPSTRPPWKSSPSSPAVAEYITVQNLQLQTISYLGVVAHNFEGCEVSVQTCASLGASPQVWTTLDFGSPTSYTVQDNSPLMWRFTPGTYEGIRLKIVAPDSTPLQCGAMYVGELLVLERSVRIDQPTLPVNLGARSTVSAGRAESGHFLGKIVLTQWGEGQADFNFFSSSWFRTYFVPFLQATVDAPFFYAWSPVDHPGDSGYVWHLEDPLPSIDPVVDRFEISLRYEGYIAS